MDDRIDWKKVRERNAQYVPVTAPVRKPAPDFDIPMGLFFPGFPLL